MKTYNAVFNFAKNKGVYSISLVEDPAMQGTFIALSENKIEFKTVDEEQRIITGLVLEPNKPIYRNQNGEEFNVVFSEDTVKDLSQNFYKQGYQTNSSVEHDGNSIEGISFTESWIVLDAKNDKSNALGLNHPKGSWMATMKVDSEEIWEDYIKSGKVKGFSIDAFVELQEVKLNNHKQMDKEKTFQEIAVELKNAIIESLPKSFKKEIEVKEEVKVEFGSVNSADGGMVFMYDGETPAAGAAVWVLAEDGETKVAVPVGEHALEGGGVLVVSEEGVIAEVRAVVAEEAPAELDAVAPSAPSAPTAEAAMNEIKSLLIKYSEDSKTSRLEFEKVIDEKLKGYDEKLLTFSNEPAAKKVVSTVLEFKDMSNFQKLKHNELNGLR
jgi:hypothetical protein